MKNIPLIYKYSKMTVGGTNKIEQKRGFLEFWDSLFYRKLMTDNSKNENAIYFIIVL